MPRPWAGEDVVVVTSLGDKVGDGCKPVIRTELGIFCNRMASPRGALERFAYWDIVLLGPNDELKVFWLFDGKPAESCDVESNVWLLILLLGIVGECP